MVCSTIAFLVLNIMTLQPLYAAQGVKDKEVIAMELAAAEEHLSNSAFGQMLLRRCAPVLCGLPDASHHHTSPLIAVNRSHLSEN